MNILRRVVLEELFLSSRSLRTCVPFTAVLPQTAYCTKTSTGTAAATTSSSRSENLKPKTQRPLQQSLSPDIGMMESVVSKTNDWPRPSEIPWQAKVSNMVNLIGYVQIPVQFQTSHDGKYWAGTIISQQDSNSGSSSFWIPVIFEGDLAHIAACHLKEKDHVYIGGQLSADPPPFTLSQGQPNVQVLAHSINFVQGFSRPKKSFVPQKQEWDIYHSGSVTKDRDHIMSSWRDLLKNPKQWWDHRENKRNGLVKEKHPDFKHKDTENALWLNTAPEWILSGLEGLEVDVHVLKMKQAKNNKEDCWKNLVENPDRWWDNRSNKVNVKGPDFKHKDTGEGLWLSDAPVWALSRLPPLKVNQNVAV